LDPPQLVFVLQTPIRLIQLLTDPVVDGFAIILSHMVAPIVLSIVAGVFHTLVRALAGGAMAIFGEEAAHKVTDHAGVMVSRVT
jgi:E3 ubiquitin-protein ligase MARCH6